MIKLILKKYSLVTIFSENIDTIVLSIEDADKNKISCSNN